MKSYVPVFFLFIYLSSAFSQSQIGQTLFGDGPMDLFGQSVEISYSGDTIAIGAPHADPNALNSGMIKVFGFRDNEWRQIGSTITGANDHDNVGYSMSLSRYGQKLAVAYSDSLSRGKVVIYELKNGDWSLTQEFQSEYDDDDFGASIDFSANGEALAIGAPKHRVEGVQRGRVEVYSTWRNQGWERAAFLVGSSDHESLGHKVEMYFEGNGVFVTDPKWGSRDLGILNIFFRLGGKWTAIDSLSDGLPNTGYGESLAIDHDLATVAVGAPYYDTLDLVDCGSIRIYRYNGVDVWLPKGHPLVGRESYTFLGEEGFLGGRTLALSSDSKWFAVGSPRFGPEDRGRVRGYRGLYFGGNAVVGYIGSGAYSGDGQGDFFGSSVGINHNGERVIIGAPLNDENGIDAGHVKVFNRFWDILSSKNHHDEHLQIYPNPARDVIELQFNTEMAVFSDGKIDLVDTYGKTIFSERLNGAPTQSIDVSSLSSGTYLVRISDGGKSFSQRLVIQRN